MEEADAMKAKHRSPAIRRALERARKVGFRVEFVPEPIAVLPGVGSILPPLGHCDYEHRIIRVATGGHSRAKIAAILEHEVEHAEGAAVATARPEFGIHCGNRGRHDPLL
jgi:hypothetical protein